MEQNSMQAYSLNQHFVVELQQKAKDDPGLAGKLEAMQRIFERYSEALQRLADS